MKKVETIARDYRGMDLCDPCWNGHHFVKSEFGKGMICNCNLGLCGCPCSQMQAHDGDVRRDQKARRLELAKTQMDMSTFGTIDIR